MFWRQDGVEYFCMITFLLYIIGRESIQVHLLCLCIERCFALSVSLFNVFRKLTTLKGRLVISVVCIILSIVIFAPIVFLYSIKDFYSCGPETLFGSHVRFIFCYCRTVFSLQIILMVGIYLYILQRKFGHTLLPIPLKLTIHNMQLSTLSRQIQKANQNQC